MFLFVCVGNKKHASQSVSSADLLSLKRHTCKTGKFDSNKQSRCECHSTKSALARKSVLLCLHRAKLSPQLMIMLQKEYPLDGGLMGVVTVLVMDVRIGPISARCKSRLSKRYNLVGGTS